MLFLSPVAGLILIAFAACGGQRAPGDTDGAVEGGVVDADVAGSDSGGSLDSSVAAQSHPVVCPDDDPRCAALRCSAGYSCAFDTKAELVWVMKDDGNVNGPSCQRVCEAALANSCSAHACDHGRLVEYSDLTGFAPVAESLGFRCKEGGCWWPDAPSEGQYLVSIEADDQGARSCFFPTESTLSCTSDPGNANCFGERYASVCPCVAKPLDAVCEWECPPHGTTRSVWKTQGSSCLARINYWRRRACEEGWPECPPAGLPPMAECTACHECANSEAAWDKQHGAHDSFKRCGESSQGEGGGATCADVIDSFISERAPDESGVMRCRGHCGPILRPGCQTFHWGKDQDSGFHTLNWGSCNVDKCESYCGDHPDDCFVHDSSPELGCDAGDDAEANPVVAICQ